MRLPLRLRLTLAFAVGMAFVLSGLGAFVYWQVGKDMLASLDLSLSARAQVIVNAIGQSRSPLIESTGRLIDTDESLAQVLDSSGTVIESSSPALARPLLPATDLTGTQPTSLIRDVPLVDSDPLRFLIVPVGSRADRDFVVVGGTLGDRRDALRRLLVAFVVGGPVALLLTSLAGWLVAGAVLRPVEAMRRQAEAISVSEPERRLPVSENRDELARLGATLNAMLGRLQEAFERERRFVDDASHELRTPLSVLKMEQDLALARSRTPEELESALRNASLETDRLVRLAEDLLVLARAERGRLPVHREQTSLRHLISQTAVAHRPKAEEFGVRIELDLDVDSATVDPARIRQAVENLLDNALRHSSEGGVIRLRTMESGAGVLISVEDSGPGFPDGFLDRAFEPFARDDAGALRDGQGAGLGLAIVRAVAEAHGGRANAENLSGGGARVTFSVG